MPPPALRLASPREVALRMLACRFDVTEASPRASQSGVEAARDEDIVEDGLASFQREAVHRLSTILTHRGGAIHADSVGLGKTHVAAHLVRRALALRRPVLVSGPATLAAHWRRHLRHLRGWDWLSHTSLSRGATWRGALRDGAPTGRPRPFIVVDEAHAFRNPSTGRYRTLAALASDAELLLITATPVNNSIRDFYHLVRLFARDDAFADIGVPDMASAFDAADGGDAEGVRRIAETVVVRRTRRFVERACGSVLGGAARLRFPRTGPIEALRYAAGRRTLGRATIRCIGELEFPVHRLHAGAGAAELLRLSLLKRLESSPAAFTASVARLDALLRRFREATEGGFLFAARDRTRFARPECSDQLVLDAVALEPWPPDIDRGTVLRQVAAELARLTELRERHEPAAYDAKLDALRSLLTGRLRDERVLVFTEYRDTAVHLWRALTPLGGVALIHGGDARLGRDAAARSTVVRRFAPLANGSRPPRPHEAVRVLIATDVLAEGLNLQDARAVVCYDVPWNPVRLAQRTGRIDRLGSPHDEVLAFTFLPDRGLDELLGLMRRVRRKLRQIRLVGGDAPRLASAGREPLTDPRWDMIEELRAAYAAAVEGMDASGVLDDDGGVVGVVAGAGDTALCCVTAGPATWLVVVRGGRVDPTIAPESILRDVMSGAGDGPVDGADPRRVTDRATRAGRVAVRWVRNRLAGASASAPRGPARRAARLVHRWLANRPGGATAADCATADALLRGLEAAHAVALQQDLAALMRRRLPEDDAVAAMHALVAEPRAGRQRRLTAERMPVDGVAATDAAPTRRPQAHRHPVRLRAVLLLDPGEPRPDRLDRADTPA